MLPLLLSRVGFGVTVLWGSSGPKGILSDVDARIRYYPIMTAADRLGVCHATACRIINLGLAASLLLFHGANAIHSHPAQFSVPTGVGTLILRGKGGILSVYKIDNELVYMHLQEDVRWFPTFLREIREFLTN